jgi:hypothetical protein
MASAAVMPSQGHHAIFAGVTPGRSPSAGPSTVASPPLTGSQIKSDYQFAIQLQKAEFGELNSDELNYLKTQVDSLPSSDAAARAIVKPITPITKRFIDSAVEFYTKPVIKKVLEAFEAKRATGAVSSPSVPANPARPASPPPVPQGGEISPDELLKRELISYFNQHIKPLNVGDFYEDKFMNSDNAYKIQFIQGVQQVHDLRAPDGVSDTLFAAAPLDDPQIPGAYTRREICGDGNCFINAYSALLMDLGSKNPAMQAPINALLIGGEGSYPAELMSIFEQHTSDLTGEYAKQKWITALLKPLLAHYIQDEMQQMKADDPTNYKAKVLTIHQAQGGAESDLTEDEEGAVLTNYYQELRGDGAWLGLETLGFIKSFFDGKGIYFSDTEIDPGGTHADINNLYFKGIDSQHGRMIEQGQDSDYPYGLYNPYGGHWTLLIQD